MMIEAQASQTTQHEPQTTSNIIPDLPQKRPADVLINYQLLDDGSIDPLIFWDGSEELSIPHTRSNACHQACLNSKQRQVEMAEHEDPTRPDHDSSDEDLYLSNHRGMSRQEMKQHDREIPWRDIMRQDEATIQKYVDSAIDEYNGWMKWGGVRPLTKDEVKQVRNSPTLRKRIMRSIAAYRDKNGSSGPLKAKTRVVVIGCADPDLRQMSRDSPTPTRLSEMIILRQFNQDGLQWTLWLSDADKAFLQGFQDKTERSGPIDMEPPCHPIQQRAQAFVAELYEILGNCYGLRNAPGTWFVAVDTRLKQHGFIQHSLDKCFYMHFDEKGQLNCAPRNRNHNGA